MAFGDFVQDHNNGSNQSSLTFQSPVTAGNTLFLVTFQGLLTNPVADDLNDGDWVQIVDNAGERELSIYMYAGTDAGTPTVSFDEVVRSSILEYEGTFNTTPVHGPLTNDNDGNPDTDTFTTETLSVTSVPCIAMAYIASRASASVSDFDSDWSLDHDSDGRQRMLSRLMTESDDIDAWLQVVFETDNWGSAILAFSEASASTDPTITNVDTLRNGESADITVENVSASGNTVTLGGVSQTVTNEEITDGDGTITITVVRGDLEYGDHDLVVTDDDSNESDPSSQTLNPQTGWNEVDLADVIPLWAESESATTGDQRVSSGQLYEATTTGTTGSTAPTHKTGTESDGGVSWEWQQKYDRITAEPDLEGNDQLAWGNVQGGSIGDVTVNAPGTFVTTGTDQTLTSPSATATGATTANWSVDTDGDSGPLHWVISTNSTKPKTEQIIAGEDSTGSAAADAGTETVSASGEQTGTASGLSEDATYYFFSYHQSGVTAFDVEAHDGEWGATATQTVTGEDSSVVSSNSFTTDEEAQPTPVVADAGTNQTVTYNDEVQLNGGLSTGDGLTYAWTQTSGTSVTLSDDSIVNPTFTAPGSDATLVFELEVTDENETTDTDSVTISVVETIETVGRRGMVRPMVRNLVGNMVRDIA